MKRVFKLLTIIALAFLPLRLMGILPLQEVVDLQVSIPTHHHEIFSNYTNDNFSQKIRINGATSELFVHIKSSNYFSLDMRFPIKPNKELLASLPPTLSETIRHLQEECYSFKTYFRNISFFLESHLVYSEAKRPQDAVSVFEYRKANCVGYSNLVKVMLDAAGIENEIVRGFYLKKETSSKRAAVRARRNARKARRQNMYPAPGLGPTKKAVGKKTPKYKTLVPVPHRWLEITLADGTRFFYDPQHQSFSENYITIKNNIDFKSVKKFKVILLKKSKKIINQ